MTPAETSPTRSAGRCSPRVGALATPALYPAHFSTPRFTCHFRFCGIRWMAHTGHTLWTRLRLR